MVGGGSIILALAGAAMFLTMIKIKTNPIERNILDTKGKSSINIGLIYKLLCAGSDDKSVK